jgi:ribonuclease G
MQITRQRVRPATEINTSETCPTCNGTGKVGSSILIADNIERQLAYYVKDKGYKSLSLKVNPIIYSHLTRGLFSLRLKWMYKFKCSLKVISSSENSLLEYIWLNNKGERIEY